jgi:cytochrome b561
MVHEVHAAIVGIIVLTIALHVAAALFHQLILKDNIIRRIALKRFED